LENRIKRRLAAIVAADVVGWSSMMGADEAGTLQSLKSHRKEMIDPKIAEYGGRIVSTSGDSVLVEYPSAVDAVQCAIEIQEGMIARNEGVPVGKRMRLRIGVNLGDVIIEGEDVFGDGVNVAARLEAAADPDGISVSGNIYEHIVGRLPMKFTDTGLQTFKNIEQPVRVWTWSPDTKHEAAPPVAQSKGLESGVREQPAIAVLPFDNMGAGSADDYFSDGLTEDIITALTYWRSFPVIARNSSFAYKGKSFDVRSVGRELGARYVLEGSIRKQGPRVRVNAQLIDSETGHHVWADKFDRNIEDIFELQDEIVQTIAALVAPEIDRAELSRSISKQSKDLNAWDLCLRAKPLVRKRTPESVTEARDLFLQAIKQQQDCAEAHAGLAMSYSVDIMNGVADPGATALLAMNAAKRAVECDDASSWAHHELSTAYQLLGRTGDAIAEARIAVHLNPNDAYTLHALGNKSDLAGDPNGISIMEKAQILCPEDARSPVQLSFLARAFLNAGNYEAAIERAREAIRKNPEHPTSHFILALALGLHRDLPGAREALRDCERLSPGFVAARRTWRPYGHPDSNERLRKALSVIE
jgi:adenylate cyclase